MAKKRKSVKDSGRGRTNAARVMCLVLAALMLLGCATTLIAVLFAQNVTAAAYSEPDIRVGIQYGSTVVTNYRTYTPGGYILSAMEGSVYPQSTDIGRIGNETVVVSVQGNLAPTGTGYAPSVSGVVIGGCRLEHSSVYSSLSEAVAAVGRVSTALNLLGYSVFPAYKEGKYTLRVGCFLTEAEAELAAGKIDTAAALGGTFTPVSPVSTGVTLLSSDGQVILDFDHGQDRYLAISPISSDAYIKTDSGNIYEGAFLFRPSGANMTVINVLGLESYVVGVLPYEISSSWPIEAQKAFAIASRSYAIGNMGKHERDYGFDMCASTNCQTYRGVGSVTDLVRRAVKETEGLVINYQGRAVGLNYSSSTGGCTVSAEDCWGGTGAPYLTAVSTPWERYADYPNGLWTVEVSPTELLEYLVSKGYTTLKGAVASVTVVATAENSTYVKSLKVTDTSGTSVTVTNTDNVRAALTKYVKSSNFTVGKGSVTQEVAHVSAGGADTPYSYAELSLFAVMTSSGMQISNSTTTSPTVATGSGNVSAGENYGYVITAANANGTADGSGGPGYTAEYETVTYTATSPDNFIFAGKGWGHGVGLSQYGTKDLADFGYTYDRILAMYSPHTEITHLSDM